MKARHCSYCSLRRQQERCACKFPLTNSRHFVSHWILFKTATTTIRARTARSHTGEKKKKKTQMTCDILAYYICSLTERTEQNILLQWSRHSIDSPSCHFARMNKSHQNNTKRMWQQQLHKNASLFACKL